MSADWIAVTRKNKRLQEDDVFIYLLLANDTNRLEFILVIRLTQDSTRPHRTRETSLTGYTQKTSH